MKSLLMRLLAVVSVALVPALAFQVYAEFDARHLRQQLAEDEALRLVRQVSAEGQRITEGADQALNALSAAPSVQDAMPQLCQRLLAELLEQSPRYNSTAVIGLDGHLLCAPGPTDSSIDASDRSWFRRALATGGFVIGEYTVGRVSGLPTIHMAKPFRNAEGVVAGVVDLSLSLEWLGQQLEHLDLPPRSIVTISDRNGTTLARRPGQARFAGQPIPEKNRYLLEGKEIRVFPMTSLDDGRPLIVANSPPGADPEGFSVGVGLDRETAFAAVTQANRTGLLLITGSAALALALTALLGIHLIRRPVRRLLGVAERWRGGDLAARSGIWADGSEFGRLATAFDRMAAAQEARERLLHTVLESTTDSVMMFDRSWRVTYLSERAKAHVAQGRDLVGQILWEALPGTADSVFAKGCRAAMESGEQTHTVGYSAAFGTWLEAHAYPTKDGLTAFFRDVAEKRRIAAELSRSEERDRAIFEQAAVGMAQAGLDGTWLCVNDKLCEIIGHTREDLLGGTTLDITHPDDVAADRARMAALIGGEDGSASMEKRYIRKDGGVVWTTNTISLLHDVEGRPVCFIGIIQDITARKHAEADLQQATALLSAVGACSADPIYAKDAEGRFLFANPALLAVIGLPAEAVIGRTDAEWRHDRQQAATVMANDRRIIETGRTEVLEEFFDAVGRGTRVFRSAKAPLQMADGRTLGLVTVSSDITLLKQAEAELRRLTEDLEGRVREEVAAREAAQARAAHAERMQALGQLASGIAHDFNNVLQSVMGAATLIERRAEDPAGTRRFARRVIEAAERGGSITRRLLAFARRGDLKATHLGVATLLSGMHEILAFTLGTAIEMHVRLGEGLPKLLANKGQLETVLVNLATNARDAMPNGGQLIIAADTEIVPPDDPPHNAGLAPGRYVRLSVADSGTGMDAATLAQAAEPFFTTKAEGAGTGLGLPMARGFAEQSGGAVGIESRPGKGTTVTLWLPEASTEPEADTTEPEAAEAAAPATAQVKPRARLLLVDDEELVREIMAETLEDAGFAVLAAASGAEALALLVAGQSVDALITDLTMPGMDGLALIGAVHERWPGLPAVLLTGHAADSTALTLGGAASGSFLLLRKPVGAAQLFDRIRTLLGTRLNA